MALLSTAIGYGLLASRASASAGIAGALYFATDTNILYRCNGSSWDNVANYATTPGTVTSVTGTTPIASSGGTTPAISIAAATTTAVGAVKEKFQCSQISDVTVSNTITATSLLSGTIVGTKTLAANAFTQGRTLHVVAAGLMKVSSVSAGVLLLKLKLGSTVVKTLQIAFQSGNTDQPLPWRADFEITCRTIGGSGTVKTTGFAPVASCQDGLATLSDTVLGGWDPAATNPAISLDTTGTLALDLTNTWSVAHANNSTTLDNFYAEWIG